LETFSKKFPQESWKQDGPFPQKKNDIDWRPRKGWGLRPKKKTTEPEEMFEEIKLKNKEEKIKSLSFELVGVDPWPFARTKKEEDISHEDYKNRTGIPYRTEKIIPVWGE